MTTTSLPLGRAHLLATTAIREAAQAGLAADAFVIVGRLRRFEPVMDGVSLLAVAPASLHSAILTGFAALPIVKNVTARRSRTIRIETARGPVTLHLAEPDQAGAAQVWHTGSSAHRDELQRRAARLGLRFANARLHGPGRDLTAPTETSVYEHLQLPCIPPELREGNTELLAAERGELPNLISMEHVRGDLHMHSLWSDGRDTIEQMACAAKDLGYEYIAITDHSERSWASRRLARGDIARQRDELNAVRARLAGIDILHGVEVDIMPDGSLDFDDEVLAGFDIVLASLHDASGHGRDALTERYLRAMRHPLVNVITHPANRSPAFSPGYDLDFARLFAAAVETGTAMEVDGAPGHLDMDGAVAREAIAAGVTIAIDSDCHRSDALERQMRFGVGTARRGWVEPRHVLNTRPLPQVRDFVARKRAGA